MTFKLITDSCCDLPYMFLEENDVSFLSMMIHLHGEEFPDDLGKTFDYTEFLHAIQQGELPTTSQVNVGQCLEMFKYYADQKIPVLYLAFSSELSGSYQSAKQAVQMLREEYGQVDIYVIDTKAASLGEGLLVKEVVDQRNEGKNLDEVIDWLMENISNVQSWVTVDDLAHLERGGRISKVTAKLGGLLNIKPIIHVDEMGRLQNVDRVRGRKKALQRIAQETIKGLENPSEKRVFIAYSGDIESAEKVKSFIEESVQVKEICLYPLGPTITTHTGYGCVAVFAMGKNR